MHRTHLFLSAALLGLLASCTADSEPDQAEFASENLAAMTPGLTAKVSASSGWDGGFNGLITISNTTGKDISGWVLKFKLNGGASLSGSPWGAAGSATQGSDGAWTVLPNTWGGDRVPANGSVTASFGANGGSFSGVSTCTINSYNCDGTGTGSSSSSSSSSSSGSGAGGGTGTGGGTGAGGGTGTGGGTGAGGGTGTGGRMYVGYSGTWNTSIADLTTATIPSYYTHLNLAFVRPDMKYKKGSRAFDQSVAGFEFAEGATTNSGQKTFTAAQAQALVDNIKALRARGTQIWISVGGWSYSQGSQWAGFSPQNVVDLAEDLGADGIDLDWESSGSSCNKATADQFSCSKDAEIAGIITSLYTTIKGRGDKIGISIAGWSTGAYYVKGTPFEEGKVQWGSPFGGTMYSVVKNHGNKLTHINLMSYDGGDYYDPREGYEAYRAIYSGPIAMGLEIAPEGAGGATLRLNADPGAAYDAEVLTGQNNMATKYYSVETLTNYMKNKGKPGDGMMVWQIWKERVYAAPPAGAAGVNATGQKVCQMLGITSNCNQSIPNLPKL